MNETIVNHFLKFSQYTFPGCYREYILHELPNTVADIGILVRQQIVHRMTLKNGNTGSNSDLRYGDMAQVPWYRQPEDDVFTTASSIISELFRRDPRGITKDRLSKDKLVLTCRFTSILMASILKTKGIPSRVRSGFAPYFNVEGLPGGKSNDHWIVEYWDKNRSKWIAADVDGSLEGYIKFNPYDMPDKLFDYSADAWLDARSGKVDANHFYNAGGTGGLIAIAWELFYDFHCLMNNEVIYSHTPEITHFKNFENLDESKLREIDELARLMQKPDDNFDNLLAIWETKKEFRLVKGGLI